jgi:hypothetical protein
VPNVEDFNFCPLERIRRALNQQKVRIWRWSGRKNKNYCVRSQNVYENKRNMDKMPGEMSDICGNSTSFCREIQKLDGQFGSIRTLERVLYRYSWRRANAPAGVRAPDAALIPQREEAARPVQISSCLAPLS